MQTHGGSFSNSFSTCIRQQIQIYSSWSESKQRKFSDIGNGTFRQEGIQGSYGAARGQSQDSTYSQIWVTAYFSGRVPAQQQNSQRDLFRIHYFPLTVGNSKV